MPTFATPAPISVTIELVVGDIRITASDRANTVVEVRPRDDAKADDIKAAAQTHVEYEGGELLVKRPRNWRQYSPFGSGGAVDVTIDLPTGSLVDGDLSMGKLHGEGELGACRFTTAMGNIRLDQVGALHLSTSSGNIAVDHARGDVDVSTASGELRLQAIDGAALIKNSNGATMVGEVAGDLRVQSANGRISVDRAQGSVTAKTARGDLRVGAVGRGVIVLETAIGDVEIGIEDGTAAWLDLSSKFGSVRNTLEDSDGPQPSDATVEVRAVTSVGDIVVRRAPIRQEARSS